jgi:dipeptidyl aminopeptidase/acylaminoacyl peptidase
MTFPFTKLRNGVSQTPAAERLAGAVCVDDERQQNTLQQHTASSLLGVSMAIKPMQDKYAKTHRSLKVLSYTTIALSLLSIVISFASTASQTEATTGAKTTMAQLPHLLSRAPSFNTMKLSPDGKHIAATVTVQDKTKLVFLDAARMNAVGFANLGNSFGVGEFVWVSNKRVILEVVQYHPWVKQPVSYGDLFGINLDGSKSKVLFGSRAGEKVTGSRMRKAESVYAWGSILATMPEDDSVLVKAIPMTKEGDAFAQVYTMNANSGVLSGRVTVPLQYADILVDKDQQVRFAVGYNDVTEQLMWRNDDDEWITLSKHPVDHFYPLSLAAKEQAVLGLDRAGADTLGLVQLGLAEQTRAEIFRDKNVDITQAMLTTDQQDVYAVRLDNGLPSYAMLNQTTEEAKIFKALLESFPGSALSITSQSQDGQQWLIDVSSDINPGTFYLYDHGKKSLEALAHRYQQLASTTFASTEAIEFKSFDGHVIPGYLTKTPQATKNKPLVVLVHGGPHGVRDYWGYDPEVQLLALSGYNVLQVNYRGSYGFGKAFEDAGKQQWGDAIQRDIISGTEWAIAQGHGKAGNVCIMGTSFGGYSAVQAATIAPDLYRCAIAVAGVYDLPLLVQTSDVAERQQGRDYLGRVLGVDPALLQAHSPVNHVHKLKANLLIAHGKKDARAPYDQALSLKKALDNAGKSYQWLDFNDESHGFYSEQNQQIYFGKVQAFLATQLHTN